METNKIYCGDCLEVLKTFPDNSIDCVVTSPPYYNLRSYLPEDHPDKDKEIGFGGSPEAYVNQLVEVFREVRRVLKPEGTCYLNLGDSWASNGIYIGKYVENHPDKENLHTEHHRRYPQKVKGTRGGAWNIKKKDLLMIPARVAIALSADGWYLRSDIIYAKKNCMPNPCSDRPVASYEHVFLLTKSPNYYWNWEAIATEPAESTQADKRPKGVLRQRSNENSKYHDGCDPKISAQFKKQDHVGRSDYTGFNDRYTPVDKVRRRDVWTLTVPGSKIKHFAMFNPKLVELCISSGCPTKGLVLDPFGGAGTVGLVASSIDREYVLIELNSEYVKTAESYIGSWVYDVNTEKVSPRFKFNK